MLGGETPPSLAGGDACATTDRFNRTRARARAGGAWSNGAMEHRAGGTPSNIPSPRHSITPFLSICRLRAFDRALFHPRHQGPQPGSDFFNGMLLAFLEQRVIAFIARLVFLDPVPGELARLNVPQGGLHSLLHARVDDLWAHRHVAPLGRFGN